MTERDYGKLVNNLCPESPMGKDCIWAFCIGGLICTVGQVFLNLCFEAPPLSKRLLLLIRPSFEVPSS